MAKVTNPLLSMSASGKIGNSIVFDKRGRARIYVIPANPQTAGQMSVRNTLGDIQRSLVKLGATLRGQLRTGFGATWNSMIVGELMANGNAALDGYVTTWNAYTSGEKTAWGTADTAVPVLLIDGQALYACALAAKAIALRLGVVLTLTTPTNVNAATVGAEWIA